MNQSSGNILKTFVESVAEQGLANESPGPESLAPQAPEEHLVIIRRALVLLSALCLSLNAGAKHRRRAHPLLPCGHYLHRRKRSVRTVFERVLWENG